MKVFISWSGNRSRALANALRDWLPMVLQYVKPWVSDKDIGAGDRWAQQIAGELETSNFGIICVTPENLQSEWILFEAGALSKSMMDAKVIPLLFGLELSNLSGPLSQFQAQKVEEAGILEVIRAINKVSNGQTDDSIVNRLVPQLWPSLRSELDKIKNTEQDEKRMRPSHEILEELVTAVRGLNSRIRETDPEAVERERILRRRKMRFHPRMFEELLFMSREMDDVPIILILLAGFLREDYPWLSELLSESYREIRSGNIEDVDRALTRLRRSIKQISRTGMMRDAMSASKDAMMIFDELPMFLDMAIHHISESERQTNYGEIKE